MTRDTAKKITRHFPPRLQDIAKKDIEDRAYKTVELVPHLMLSDGYFQMTVNYTIDYQGKTLYGRADSVEDFVRMHDEAERGEYFTVTYLEGSGIILEIENRDDN